MAAVVASGWLLRGVQLNMLPVVAGSVVVSCVGVCYGECR